MENMKTGDVLLFLGVVNPLSAKIGIALNSDWVMLLEENIRYCPVSELIFRHNVIIKRFRDQRIGIRARNWIFKALTNKDSRDIVRLNTFWPFVGYYRVLIPLRVRIPYRVCKLLNKLLGLKPCIGLTAIQGLNGFTFFAEVMERYCGYSIREGQHFSTVSMSDYLANTVLFQTVWGANASE